MQYNGKEFETKEALFDYLKQNKSMLIMQKKSAIKHTDSIAVSITKNAVNKESIDISRPFIGKLVINTTNLLDSHSDVHLPGIWTKSLNENKNIMLLQEHEMSFDHVISDKVKASAETISWNELGFNYTGNTQALMFDAEIDSNRNRFMAEQYANGYVKNHSVGMQYVKLELAMDSNSINDQEEKAVWDKYINEIANKEDAIAQGFFWAVHEAKIIEGSAVVRGSNFATPTLSLENKEPLKDTQEHKEPTIVTQSIKLKLFNLKN